MVAKHYRSTVEETTTSTQRSLESVPGGGCTRVASSARIHSSGGQLLDEMTVMS